MQLLVGLHEAVLHDLVRVLLAARQTEGQPEDTSGVTLDEHPKSFHIAGLRPRDKRVVALHEHSNYLDGRVDVG